ncbi:uncharacterized protein LOC134268499, partial [Saccostrea cucullata]|uniref:uncharacterized protein LOC134268499 n=1 Tax=Saccostrea cuccullata TaxID=36930 RepID=UPI002ED24909
MTTQKNSFYEAQGICRQYRSYLIPLSPTLFTDSNIESPTFAYFRDDFWTGGYDSYGLLVMDGAPPSPVSAESGQRGIVVSQNWTDTSPLCIGTRDRLRELQVRSCYERLPFFCYKEADVLSFRLGLNICPSGWVGSADVKSCYLMMSADSAVSQPDAFQYCNQNGGQLLQLNFLTDEQLAMRILGHYRLINTS